LIELLSYFKPSLLANPWTICLCDICVYIHKSTDQQCSNCLPVSDSHILHYKFTVMSMTL